MDTIARAKALGCLHDSLQDDGFTVRELCDFAEVPELIARMGKPYMTPLSDPGHNDFTSENVIWMVAECATEPALLGCARLEDLGSETVSSYWLRSLSRAYGGGVVIEKVRPEVEKQISGRLVYFGDLYMNKALRGARSLAAIRSFVALGHLATSLKWNPDWTYCFIREMDLLRGASMRYGFPLLFADPFNWINPPGVRSNSEWLAALPRAELKHVVAMAVEAAKSAKVK